jgi:hypothetical protein
MTTSLRQNNWPKNLLSIAKNQEEPRGGSAVEGRPLKIEGQPQSEKSRAPNWISLVRLTDINDMLNIYQLQLLLYEKTRGKANPGSGQRDSDREKK